ncbi:N-acetylmuramic acid 6-phosphate etherase [Lactobacillus sp. ESL0684]|uniref:N-acetylmuramic acid 6-phosphate etherase n=1 Tax=unclassified Lactobacillus TaxID=2620435 RepID=UPI0023F9A50C|nr:MULTISPECIES: N-acetylmuramic acid 6-phosphate etherase [unclassified Lactobacillus]WEV39535.1 N-acetylmuramic acid 6-phosphate etherase [Lactobacillus sp. ESL0681]WEV43949.1 N-acetylmuramic acid 6-phosphate etherase [Lactobacillus sp. ESL0684]
MEIKNLVTETRNPATTHIDTMSTLEMVKTINREDQKVAEAVATQAEPIAQVIDAAAKLYAAGGRLIYVGAGTSGRLGVLDAAELVPTYGIKSERAIGLIAGGQKAMYHAVEGAEDSAELGQQDLRNLNLTANDTVIGLAASGRTPYVVGCLDYAKEVGALTTSIACVPDSVIGEHADIAIEAVVGPEVVTGSTRMKAGSAQKMILNMISTGIMIRQGKVYENVMIDVQPTNAKLVDRACRIINVATGATKQEALTTLEKTDNNVALAIVMLKTGKAQAEAASLLEANHGNVSQVLQAD